VMHAVEITVLSPSCLFFRGHALSLCPRFSHEDFCLTGHPRILKDLYFLAVCYSARRLLPFASAVRGDVSK
jgi:hypothetical protein